MEISKEEKLDQLSKLLRSRTLTGSDSLKSFLRFVVEKASENPENQLKEYIIATEVFGRSQDYNPRIDSIVRVQAGRLRTKLAEYYSKEGKGDKILIDLPKGHYTPVFSRLLDETLGIRASLQVDSEEAARAEFTALAEPLWGELIYAPDPLLVVFSNTILHGTYEQGMKLYKASDAEFAEEPEQFHSLPIVDHYTGIGEAMGVYFLSDFFGRIHHPFRVKRSLSLSWDDVKIENIIVLGSPAENLFLKELPQKQDFVFRPLKDHAQDQWLAIINTNPQEGEQEHYTSRQFGPSPSQISEDYAVISVLKGLSERNRLMILAGINTFGTQAAVEYVTQPEYIRDLTSHLNIAPPGEAPQLPNYFQLVLKVKVSGGVPIQISYVTHHVLEQ
ncbi:MAG: hypothetical protein JST85_12710 [Acidobacteria bacterium]|nr:hypothetical protein [Acidobacteriota bacterium]